MPVDAVSAPALVAVVAHPDDEVLIAGGTLALAAAAGTPTAVVSLTCGERGPVAAGSLRRGEVRPVIGLKRRALAAHRTQFAPDHLLAGLPPDLWARYLGDEAWTGDVAGLRRALGGATMP